MPWFWFSVDDKSLDLDYENLSAIECLSYHDAKWKYGQQVQDYLSTLIYEGHSRGKIFSHVFWGTEHKAFLHDSDNTKDHLCYFN